LAETRQLTCAKYLFGAKPLFNAQTAIEQEIYADSRIAFLELNPGAVSQTGAKEATAKLE
jgi:hypothetical protein